MIVALVGLVLALAMLASLGVAATRALLPRSPPAIVFAATPIVGLAIALGWLDLVGFLFPLRLVAWTLPVLAVASIVVDRVRARRLEGRTRFERRARLDAVAIAALVVVGAIVGLLPVVFAGRLGVAALTNDDATFYVTAADRLRDLSWLARTFAPSACLSEKLVHAWFWRTGIPNLVAAVAVLARIETTSALAIVTALVVACVPVSAVFFVGLLGGARRRGAVLVVGAVTLLGASTIFVAYQQFLSQLLGGVLFPSACAACAFAVARGRRWIALAAILFGASVTAFADGAPFLVVGALAALLVATRASWRDRVRRLGVVAGATCLSFAPATYRAFIALTGTLFFRLPAARPMFPQSGWLRRPWIDDLTTIANVDPWPPWPWPHTLGRPLAWVGALAALALLVVGLRALPRRRALLAFCGVVAAMTIWIEAFTASRYFLGKVLLMDALLALPIVALGVWSARGAMRVAVVPWVVALVAADATLVHPSAFHVVDADAHDQLVPVLAALPRGSLLALDGFGASADDAHDEHRAYRAALLADLRPIQPGGDGGFYRPVCGDPPPLLAPPERAWALQRPAAETLSRGRVIASFGPFVLREADLRLRDALVGAWAPTVGWKDVEREPDGAVFRWGAADAVVELRVVSAARCARIEAEVRTDAASGVSRWTVGGKTIAELAVGGTWTSIATAPFDVLDAQTIELHTDLATPPPDELHALAVRSPSIEPVRCDARLVRVGRSTPSGEGAVPEPLVDALDYAFDAPAGARCVAVHARLEDVPPGRVGVRTPTTTAWVVVSSSAVSIDPPPFDASAGHALTVLRAPLDPAAPPSRLVALTIEPTTCP